MAAAAQSFNLIAREHMKRDQAEPQSGSPDAMNAKLSRVAELLLAQGFDIAEGQCEGARALAVKRGFDPNLTEGVDFLKPRRDGTGTSELVGISRRVGNPPGNYWIVRGDYEVDGRVTKLQRILLDEFFAQIGDSTVLAFFDAMALPDAPQRPEKV